MLSHRTLDAEIMDDPGLAPERHAAALRGLRRINRWSRSDAILWPPIRALAERSAERPLRVLDIATGGGDVPVQLWRRARAAGLSVQIDGCDISPRAVQHARDHARRCGAEVRFFVLDALADELPHDYDVLSSSLFLHHLDGPQGESLLTRMAAATRDALLVNDLLRGARGLALAYFGTRLLLTSDVVRIDGVRSVRAALSLPEATDLAERAGLAGARIERRWPCRFLLSWNRP